MKKLKLKVNSVPRQPAHVTIELDADGVVKSRFWRRRLKDAETDNCVEPVIKPVKTKREQAE